MKVLLALIVLAVSLPVGAASPCEIQGKAEYWAYDACMGQFETDDELNPSVMACSDQNMALIRSKGSCLAKRIFKGRMCALLQETSDGRHSFKACMTDPSVVGSTVQNGGL